SLTLTDAYVQPVGPVEFTDDFVIEDNGSGIWEQLSGVWESQGPDSVELKPELSANPFSLSGQKDDNREYGLVAAGNWFWDDYRARVAAKASADGAMGIAAYVQDADNFLLLRWTSTRDMSEVSPFGRKQLIRARNGRWDLLDEAPGGFHQDRWYELALTVRDGWITGEIDGETVVQARDHSFGQGKVGLLSQVPGGAAFDDVAVTSTRGSLDAFDDGDIGWWLASNGDWSAKLDHLYGSVKGKASAHAVAGNAEWSRYEISAAAKPKTATSVGLTACHQPDGARYVFQWDASGQQTLSIERANGAQVLAAANQPMDDTRFYRLGLKAANGRVAALVDGVAVLEAANTELASGPAGLLVGGPGEACFDDVSVTFDESRPPDFQVTDQFTKEDTMTNWVDPTRQWRAADDGTQWYDVPMFGDFTLWLPEVDLASANGKMALVLAPNATDAPTARAEIETNGGSPELRARISKGGGSEPTASGQVSLEGRVRVAFIREGGCLSISANGEPIVAMADAGIRGRGMGLKLEGFPAQLPEMRVSSPHLVDITFSGAPTSWTPTLGVWQVTDRWPCYSGWSWFGGKGHQSVLLWGKDTLEGDQVVEFWAGLLMDQPPPGYKHPSDINAIICGDGQNLCSGYSFILAGDNNTKSKMLKGSDVVAENPNVKFVNPVSNNFAFHRHWFNVRIDKIGDHITYSVDGAVVAEWTDPEPLTAGKMGIWSWQENGILIARARMAAERIRR
ncbi:MAG TPA: hypothetical protein QGH10_09605, partial [Armatimonadota bacterium]|nr:hypothetical protein [Armatimonadota bacterium]